MKRKNEREIKTEIDQIIQTRLKHNTELSRETAMQQQLYIQAMHKTFISLQPQHHKAKDAG